MAFRVTRSASIELPQGLATTDSPTFAGLTIDNLSGVLKASSGVVSGGATTTNLTEGSNLYFTDERAQDAVGSILTNSASLTWTYDDLNNTISATVVNGAVDHNSLTGIQGGTTNEYYHLTSGEYTGSGTGVFARVSSPTFTTPTIGAATATSITIGANTLNTSEWAFLDGVNQSLATTSSPTFDAITATSLIIGANTVTTSEWAFLDGLNQTVATTSSPAFVDLTLTGGDLIASTATTFNVFNTVATTVNAFGAATALTVGATTGTATYRNASSIFSGKVGIGPFTGPNYSLTVKQSNIADPGGIAASVVALFQGTGNAQLNISCSTAGGGTLTLLSFGNDADYNSGAVEYDHSTDTLGLRVSNSNRFTLTSTAGIFTGTLQSTTLTLTSATGLLLNASGTNNLVNSTGAALGLRHTAAAGGSIQIDPMTTDGTSSCQVRLFRNTTTTNASTGLTIEAATGANTNQHFLPVKTGTTGIFNEQGLDIDWRWESTTNTHFVFKDASTSRVGINNSGPLASLDVTGTALISSTLGVTGNVMIGTTGGAAESLLELDHATSNSYITLSNRTTAMYSGLFFKRARLSSTDTGGAAIRLQSDTASANAKLEFCVLSSMGFTNTYENVGFMAASSNNGSLAVGGLPTTNATPTATLSVIPFMRTSTSGTVTVTNGSASVTTSVDLTASFSVNDGIRITSGSDDLNFTVSAITSGTITLDSVWTGSTSSSAVALRSSSSVNAFDVNNGDYVQTFRIDRRGNALWNNSSHSIEFRFRGSSAAHLLYVDGTNNKVGVANASPSTTLDVTGSFRASTTIASGTTLAVGTTMTVGVGVNTAVPVQVYRDTNTANAGVGIQGVLDNSSGSTVAYGTTYTGIQTNTAGSEGGQWGVFLINAGATPSGFSTCQFLVKQNGDCVVGNTLTVKGSAISEGAPIGGTLKTNYTGVTRTATVTTERDLQTYTMPANVMITDGDFVEINIVGTSTTDTLTEDTIRLKFGSTTLTTFTVSSGLFGTVWRAKAIVMRTGSSSSQRYVVYDSNGRTAATGTCSESLTSTVIIKATNQFNVNDGGVSSTTQDLTTIEIKSGKI